MDSFELNKILGAVLGTLLFVMAIGFVAEALYEPIEENGPGYELPEPEGTIVATAQEDDATPLPVLLASADPDAGAAAARKCQSCHNFNQGDANKTGPVLYGVVGAAVAHVDDFNYSDVFVERHEAGDVWTYEALNQFLESPRNYAPGTKMTFAGLRSEEERADILAYLQSLSDSPVPFPEPEPEAEAPAEDEAAASADAEAGAESSEMQAEEPMTTEAPAAEAEPEAEPASEPEAEPSAASELDAEEPAEPEEAPAE